MNLRHYQQSAFSKITEEWGKVNRTLLVLPTGTGKTIVFSHLARWAVKLGGRVLIVAHRDELIRQAADKLERATGITCAIEKAEECAEGCFDRVIVASVQTLINPSRRESLWRPTHIIVDEAHHAISPSYLEVLGHWPDAKVLGVTATPDRGDLRNLGTFFESLAYEYTLPQAVRDGYLCKIVVQTAPLKIDLSSVKQQSGDYQAAGLGNALEPYLPRIAEEIAVHCRVRKGLIFTPLCATAKTLQGYLRAAGVRAYYASGEDRSQMSEFEQDGPGSCCLNAMLLTEGYDHPAIDLICVLRMTKIRSLYAQMVGRGTRILDGKKNLMILDFLWNSERHDLCRPASLVADSEEIADAITQRQEGDVESLMDLDPDSVEQARQDVVKQREEALAKKLAEMRHRKRELVDPLQYAASIGDASLIDYQPVFDAESGPVSQEQIDALEGAGIYPSDIKSSGHAAEILKRLEDRRTKQMATPKMIRCLERFGFQHVGAYQYGYASHLLTRIRANGWRLPEDLAEKIAKQRSAA